MSFLFSPRKGSDSYQSWVCLAFGAPSPQQKDGNSKPPPKSTINTGSVLLLVSLGGSRIKFVVPWGEAFKTSTNNTFQKFYLNNVESPKLQGTLVSRLLFSILSVYFSNHCSVGKWRETCSKKDISSSKFTWPMHQNCMEH